VSVGIGGRLLVVLGGDEGSKATQPGRFRVAGNSDVFKFIPETFKYERLKLRWQSLRQNMRPDLSRFDCVLNLVTDPDQHPKTLDAVGKLLRGYRGRVINRPEAVMRSTREQVAKRLAGITGLRVPKVVRLRNPRPGAAATAAGRAGMEFPLIVRLAGTHTGKIVGLVDGPEALDAACSGRGEFIIIEFVDFRSKDGLYRKHRLWSFGDRSIFRHLVISDQWNVHVKDRTRFMIDRPELIDEELHLLERAEGAFPETVHEVFHDVRQRLGLDFFGMDFALDSRGDVVLFEANATMSFFPLEPHPRFSYLGKILEPAQKAFWTMLFPKN
jgi:glutathione synthase/RimK-type ligase-like ATP-grasp enzyme